MITMGKARNKILALFLHDQNSFNFMILQNKPIEEHFSSFYYQVIK